MDASRKAYAAAKIAPKDVDVATCHDCFTIAELMAYEDLGFCAKGEGRKLVREGQTEVGGRIPVNVDGGLKAKGHPVGATGVSMMVEISKQLRGEAGGTGRPDKERGRAGPQRRRDGPLLLRHGPLEVEVDDRWTPNRPRCIRSGASASGSTSPSPRRTSSGSSLGEGKFVTTKCGDCGTVSFPPQSDCPSCMGGDVEWVDLGTEAELLTFTYVQVTPTSFVENDPYVVAIGQAEGGAERPRVGRGGRPSTKLKPGHEAEDRDQEGRARAALLRLRDPREPSQNSTGTERMTSAILMNLSL